MPLSFQMPSWTQYQSDPAFRSQIDQFYKTLNPNLPTNLQYQDQFENPFGQIKNAVDRANQYEHLSAGGSVGAINNDWLQKGANLGIVKGTLTPDSNYSGWQGLMTKNGGDPNASYITQPKPYSGPDNPDMLPGGSNYSPTYTAEHPADAQAVMKQNTQANQYGTQPNQNGVNIAGYGGTQTNQPTPTLYEQSDFQFRAGLNDAQKNSIVNLVNRMNSGYVANDTDKANLTYALGSNWQHYTNQSKPEDYNVKPTGAGNTNSAPANPSNPNTAVSPQISSSLIPFAKTMTSAQKASVTSLFATGREFSSTDAQNYAYSIGDPNWQNYVGKSGYDILKDKLIASGKIKQNDEQADTQSPADILNRAASATAGALTKAQGANDYTRLSATNNDNSNTPTITRKSYLQVFQETMGSQEIKDLKNNIVDLTGQLNELNNAQATMVQDIRKEVKGEASDSYIQALAAERTKDLYPKQLALQNQLNLAQMKLSNATTIAQQVMDATLKDQDNNLNWLKTYTEAGMKLPSDALAQIDQSLGVQGFAKAYQNLNLGKVALGMDTAIADLQSKLLPTQSFSVNGQTYSGTKAPDVKEIGSYIDESGVKQFIYGIFDPATGSATPYTVYNVGASGTGTSNNNTSTGGSTILSTPKFDMSNFQSAITNQESGNYSSVNKDSGALGAYQIMPFHLPEIGLPNTAAGKQTFLNSPDLQDKLFNQITSTLAVKYNNDPAKMAAAYYGGDGAAQIVGTAAGDKPQGNYASVNQYVNKVLENMGASQKSNTPIYDALSATGKSQAKSLANYEQDPSSIPEAVKGRFYAAAKELNPSFDTSQYDIRYNFKKDWTSGNYANNGKIINTAIGHLQELQTAIKNLNNGDYPWFNKLENTLATATGSSKESDFNKVVNALADEYAKVYTGGVAGVSEVESWKNEMNAAQSKDTLASGLKYMANLMRGQIDSLNYQYQSVMGNSPSSSLVSPKNQQILNSKAFGGTGTPVEQIQSNLQAQQARSKYGY